MRGWVANLATEPFSNDTRLMEAIAAGQCDVGIVNTYYFGRLQRDNPALPVKLFWADQAGEGVHVNISGAGVTAHAPRAREAREVPRVVVAARSAVVVRRRQSRVSSQRRGEAGRTRRFVGRIQGERVNVAQAGEYQAAAVRLMDRAGYH